MNIKLQPAAGQPSLTQRMEVASLMLSKGKPLELTNTLYVVDLTRTKNSARMEFKGFMAVMCQNVSWMR